MGELDDPKAREKWITAPGHRAALGEARAALALLDPFGVEEIDASLRGVAAAREAKPKDVFQPVRVAVAGTAASPGLFESLATLGREETLARIDAVLR